MTKKIILVTVVLIAIVIVTLFVVQFVKYNRKLASIQSLPSIELQTLDSLSWNIATLAETNRMTVIICFHPDCEFCGMEADEIMKYYKDLGDVNLLFVTFASKKETAAFLEQYPLDTISNARVMLDPNFDFFNTLDVEAPPMCFIYDKRLQLVERLKGAVTVEKLKLYIEKCL